MNAADAINGTLVIVTKLRNGYFQGYMNGVIRGTKDGKIQVETSNGNRWYNAENVRIDHERMEKRAARQAEDEAIANARRAARESKLNEMSPEQRAALEILNKELSAVRDTTPGVFTYEPDPLTEIHVNMQKSHIRVDRYRSSNHMDDPTSVEDYFGLYGMFDYPSVDSKFIEILTKK